MHKSSINPGLRPLALSGALFLVACGAEEAGQAPASCAVLSGNLIQDTSFTTLFAPRSQRLWHVAEHAAGGTYEPSVKDGVLSIRKIGDEPWFTVNQVPEVKDLAGKKLAFSAEIKLDLHEPEHPHGFGYGGGLTVLAQSGSKMVVNSTLEHEPNFGTHDWQSVQVVFPLPKNTTFVRVGFVHQAGGVIQVRNPALHVVDPDCPSTVREQSGPVQPGRPSDLGRLSNGQ